MFDRRALEAFFKNRRNALSNAKKAKMKMTKQQQQQPQQQHPVSAAMRQQADMQMVATREKIFTIMNIFCSEYPLYPCFSYIVNVFVCSRLIQVLNGSFTKTGLCFK